MSFESFLEDHPVIRRISAGILFLIILSVVCLKVCLPFIRFWEQNGNNYIFVQDFGAAIMAAFLLICAPFFFLYFFIQSRNLRILLIVAGLILGIFSAFKSREISIFLSEKILGITSYKICETYTEWFFDGANNKAFNTYHLFARYDLECPLIKNKDEMTVMKYKKVVRKLNKED